MSKVGSDQIFNRAMDELNSEDLKEYQNLFDDNKQEILKNLSEAAKNEAKLIKATSKYLNKNISELEEELKMLLGTEEVEIIKEAFKNKTFKMIISTKAGRCLSVDVMKGTKQLMPTIELQPGESGKLAIDYQSISLLVEVVLFVLSAIGIEVPLDYTAMEKIVNETVDLVGSNLAMKSAIDEFINAWTQNGVSFWKQAYAVFLLLSQMYSLGFFWTIFKKVITNSSVWDYVKYIAKIAAKLVAAFISGGGSLIAELALAVVDATDISQKVFTLKQLQARENSLQFF